MNFFFGKQKKELIGKSVGLVEFFYSNIINIQPCCDYCKGITRIVVYRIYSFSFFILQY